MIVEIYESNIECSLTPVIHGDKNNIPLDDVLLHTIEGNDCMIKYHKFMKWEDYKPFI